MLKYAITCSNASLYRRTNIVWAIIEEGVCVYANGNEHSDIDITNTSVVVIYTHKTYTVSV